MTIERFVIRLLHFAITAFFVLLINGSIFGQTLYDSFSDGNFTVNPAWGGTTSTWTVVTSSDVAAGATGSNTLRLNTSSGGGTQYLSSQINTWGTSQQWGVWIGRRNTGFDAGNQQYFWLYANESNLNSATVDGYRIAIGDGSGNHEIRLEYIVNGVVSSTVITSSGAVTNGLTDIGFLVRVTRSSTGFWQLFTSVLPTTSGTGAIATDIPNSTNASVLQGSGTNNSLVPLSNGFIGIAALHEAGGTPRIAAEFDQVYFTITSATPAFTSANSTTFTVGQAGTFTVTTTGVPTTTITRSGTLPSGITFTNNGNGTATLSGTPALGTQGTYPLTFTASNGISPNAVQNFTLNVILAPSSTGAAIKGRITNLNGRSLSYVMIMLSGGTLDEPLYARASAFGFYQFSEVPVGHTYIVSVSSKRYQFEQPAKVITLMDELSDVNFVGEIP